MYKDTFSDWILDHIGRIFFIACLLFIVFCYGEYMVGCNPDYSEGTRVGTIYKLSNKGLIYKTWEGAMNLGGATSVEGRAAPNIWEFTVTKLELLHAVEDALERGYPVKVQYRQWLIQKYPRTESGYEIVSIERLQ
jgi:hypothetical protein